MNVDDGALSDYFDLNNQYHDFQMTRKWPIFGQNDYPVKFADWILQIEICRLKFADWNFFEP